MWDHCCSWWAWAKAFARETASSSTLGENVMFIWGGRAPAVEGSFTGMRQYYLTYKDYLDIRASHRRQAVAPVISARRHPRRQ